MTIFTVSGIEIFQRGFSLGGKVFLEMKDPFEIFRSISNQRERRARGVCMELETIRRQQIPAFAKLIIMNIVNNNNNKLIIIITSIINNKKKNMSDFLGKQVQ